MKLHHLLRAGASVLRRICCIALIVCGPMLPVHAGVMLNGTRIVLRADERSVSTIVSNQTRNDYAVQVWVNDIADSRDHASPFIAMPALFRVRAGEEQVVRIIKTPGELPSDRESVFYFNAQEIPVQGVSEESSLKVAVRTRVKLFYRPLGLVGTALQAPAQLEWKLIAQPSGTLLRVTNPSAYHITFIGIRVLDGQTPIELPDTDMLAPKSTLDIPLRRQVKADGATVEFSTINDHGGYQDPLKAHVGF
ncbi:fimbrial biogenesis chaperone [Pseudomonas pergaminensis]